MQLRQGLVDPVRIKAQLDRLWVNQLELHPLDPPALSRSTHRVAADRDTPNCNHVLVRAPQCIPLRLWPH